jgi:hypothetical protein
MAYKNYTDIDLKNPGKAVKEIKDTDNTVSSKWISLILNKYASDVKSKKKETTAWDKAKKNCDTLNGLSMFSGMDAAKIAVKNLGDSMKNLEVDEKNVDDVKRLIYICQGLYQRAVLLDKGKPLREPIYMPLLTAATALQKVIDQQQEAADQLQKEQEKRDELARSSYSTDSSSESSSLGEQVDKDSDSEDKYEEVDEDLNRREVSYSRSAVSIRGHEDHDAALPPVAASSVQVSLVVKNDTSPSPNKSTDLGLSSSLDSSSSSSPTPAPTPIQNSSSNPNPAPTLNVGKIILNELSTLNNKLEKQMLGKNDAAVKKLVDPIQLAVLNYIELLKRKEATKSGDVSMLRTKNLVSLLGGTCEKLEKSPSSKTNELHAVLIDSIKNLSMIIKKHDSRLVQNLKLFKPANDASFEANKDRSVQNVTVLNRRK